MIVAAPENVMFARLACWPITTWLLATVLMLMMLLAPVKVIGALTVVVPVLVLEKFNVLTPVICPSVLTSVAAVAEFVKVRTAALAIGALKVAVAAALVVKLTLLPPPSTPAVLTVKPVVLMLKVGGPPG